MRPRRRSLALLVIAQLSLTGCYQEIVLEGLVHPVDHCQEREFWLCRRELEAGRASNSEFETCRTEIDCGDAVWPPDCVPTERQHEACIERLRDESLYSVGRFEFRRTYTDCELCG